MSAGPAVARTPKPPWPAVARTASIGEDESVMVPVAAGLAGALLGAWVRASIFHFSVPRGQPWRTACPSCRSTVPERLGGVAGWLPVTGRCPACGVTIGPPTGAVEGAAGLVVAALAIRFGASAILLALAWVALIGVALAFVDEAVHRLPDRLIITGIIGTLLGFGVAALRSDGASHLGTALLGAAGAGAVYLVMVLVLPGGIGPGDAKLAVLTGLATGWFGLPVTVLAVLCTVVLAGAGAVTMLVARRASRHEYLAYGPYMLAGALIAVLV